MILVRKLDPVVLSPCERYRYWLTREVNEEKQEAVTFVMLNPSTADATQDDPTIRRCMRFAKDWGYGWLIVVNLFALRSTNPDHLYADATFDPIGPENDSYIKKACSLTTEVVCAWGNHGEYMDRGNAVRGIIERERREPMIFKLTGARQPIHPLYQRADLVPFFWKELV